MAKPKALFGKRKTDAYLERKMLSILWKHRQDVKKEVNVELLKFFRPRQEKPIKAKFYSPDVEYAIVFKTGAIDEIKAIKGWRTDVELAKALGLTRQYICNLKRCKTGVTQTVITRIASVVGNVDENWHIFYQLKPVGFIHSNQSQYNQAKSLGQIPYEKYSSRAELRKLDYDSVETSQTSAS